MEAPLPDLPELPKTKRRWLLRFSLRALLFVVLCAALGGTYATLRVREAAEKEAQAVQAAAGDLHARWAKTKAAVENLDPDALELFNHFLNEAYKANSKEALRSALGEPDQPGPDGDGVWTLESGQGKNQILVEVEFYQGMLNKHFKQTFPTGYSEQSSSGLYPSPMNIGTHASGWIAAAAILGMLAGVCFGIVAWGFLSLVLRILRRRLGVSETPASGNAPTSP